MLGEMTHRDVWNVWLICSAETRGEFEKQLKRIVHGTKTLESVLAEDGERYQAAFEAAAGQSQVLSFPGYPLTSQLCRHDFTPKYAIHSKRTLECKACVSAAVFTSYVIVMHGGDTVESGQTCAQVTYTSSIP